MNDNIYKNWSWEKSQNARFHDSKQVRIKKYDFNYE